MRKNTFNFNAITLVVIIAATTTFTSASAQPGHSKELQAKIDSMTIVLKKYAAGEATLKKNLVTFDTLDYTVFTNQEWLRLHESHSNCPCVPSDTGKTELCLKNRYSGITKLI